MKRLIKKFFDIQKQGIIYDIALSPTSGEVIVAIRKAAKVAYHITRVLGSSLIVAGLAGLIITFQPIISSEVKYRLDKFSVKQQRELVRAENLLVEASNKDRDQSLELAKELNMPNTYYSIYIPKINAKAPIIENVDTTNANVYMKALHQGVAHASGSVFPGMPGGTFLFAHSSDVAWNQTQYNAVFYLLRQLEPSAQGKSTPLGGGLAEKQRGDEIYLFFLDKVYKYEVTEKHIVAANDVSWLTNAKNGEERLILQTCWPPGTALKRLIIVAKPAKV